MNFYQDVDFNLLSNCYTDLLVTLLKEDAALTISESNLCKSLKSFLLDSESSNYSLVDGKSGAILVLSLYCRHLSGNERQEQYNQIIKKIIKDEYIILSDCQFNGILSGRSGMLLSLTFLYSIEKSERLATIIHYLLYLLIHDCRFYKKGIVWLTSDLSSDEFDYTENSLGILLSLQLFNKVFNNNFIDILLRSVYINNDKLKNILQLKKKTSCYNISISDLLLSFEGELNTDLSFEFKNRINLLQIINTCSLLPNITNNTNCLLDYHKGLVLIIESNFKDIHLLIGDFSLKNLPDLGRHLNQYTFLRLLKNEACKVDNKELKILIRRTKFKANILDKSDFFLIKPNGYNSYYFNSIICSKMSEEKFLNLKLKIKVSDVFYELIKTTWLYQNTPKRKKIIGSFIVKRFDKKNLVQINLMDGIIAKLFTYIGSGSKSISDFKNDVLTHQCVLDQNFRERVLILIGEGVLVPVLNQ